ncbi:hypothetical protein [Couchioplanes azureus]|uniref:hypothetical protein n=1 Tax=Couchioplanes caeruleus TaxID=56438 RepID=UPI00167050C5|nr:hypothetical protein [Couchioplanes caeruleus]GGQ79584.1 hypothetical protein GCM10010166_57060 [Couchioplanes caeruleus subsp. azureus]
MADRSRRLAVYWLAAAVIGGGIAAGAMLNATATTARAQAPAPSAAPAAPIQIIVPTPTQQPSSSFGTKDLLAPMGTLLGAVVGFLGAVTGARLTARAQDRRSQKEAELKRKDEDRARAHKRIEAFGDQARELFADTAKVARGASSAWTTETAVGRDALRLSAAQLLATSRLLDVEIQKMAEEFIRAASTVASATTPQAAQVPARQCGEKLDDLMKGIGSRLTPTATEAAKPSRWSLFRRLSSRHLN